MSENKASFDYLVTHDGLQLYVQWQQPAAPHAIILIVHGVGEHIGRYETLQNWLCNHQYLCYGFDQRGHGRSEGLRVDVADFNEYADDLEQVLTTIAARHPDLPIIVFSHSMGTLVALTHALTHESQYRGIILASCAIRLASAIPGWVHRLLAVTSRYWPRLRVPNLISARQLSHDAAVIERYQQDGLVMNTVTLRWLNAFLQTQDTILKNLNKINTPLLVLHSRSDRVVDIRGVHQIVDGVNPERVQYHEFETLRHELHNENLKEREIVFDAINDWCKTLIKKSV